MAPRSCKMKRRPSFDVFRTRVQPPRLNNMLKNGVQALSSSQMEGVASLCLGISTAWLRESGGSGCSCSWTVCTTHSRCHGHGIQQCGNALNVVQFCSDGDGSLSILIAPVNGGYSLIGQGEVTVEKRVDAPQVAPFCCKVQRNALVAVLHAGISPGIQQQTHSEFCVN